MIEIDIIYLTILGIAVLSTIFFIIIISKCINDSNIEKVKESFEEYFEDMNGRVETLEWKDI